jgi:hypothetical protein
MRLAISRKLILMPRALIHHYYIITYIHTSLNEAKELTFLQNRHLSRLNDFNGQKSDLKNPFVIANETVTYQ